MDNYKVYKDYLAHHGVNGQKWGKKNGPPYPLDKATSIGVTIKALKAEKKSEQNEKLVTKINKLEKKAEKYEKKANEKHAKKDVGYGKRLAKKSGKYALKSVKYSKKAIGAAKEGNESAYDKFTEKSAKYEWKSDRTKRKSDYYMKLKGYSRRPMKLALKSDKFRAAASKGEYKLKSNTRYINTMKSRYSDLTEDQVSLGYSYIEKLKEL